jgi:lipopolysaccharide assembly protein A
MRWLYLTSICLLGVVTLIFAYENTESVSMDFLWFSMRLPLAVLVIVIYIIGMLTGSHLWTLIRLLVTGARQRA